MVFNREGRLHLCSQATRKTFSKLWSPLSSTIAVLWFGCSGMYLLRFSPQHALKVWNGNKKCWMWLYWGGFLRRIYCEKDSWFLAIKPVYFSWSQQLMSPTHRTSPRERYLVLGNFILHCDSQQCSWHLHQIKEEPGRTKWPDIIY